MTLHTASPRIRALLRQARKTASAGKRAAAEQLYREILQEAPGTVEAWLGIADLTNDPAEKEAAYRRVAEMDPYNETALRALGRPVPERPVAPPDEEEQTQVAARQPAHAPQEEEILFTCYRHPDRKTNLRCYNCDRPICMQDANRTPVGYLCPICVREMEEVFYSARALDYVLAAAVSLVLGAVGGYLSNALGFFVIFLAAGGGALIGRIAFRVAGRRRGRYLPHTVAASIVIGALLVLLPPLLPFFLATGSLPIFELLWPGVFLFLAPSAAYWAVR